MIYINLEQAYFPSTGEDYTLKSPKTLKRPANSLK
jgi:hypothetical protein